MSIESRPKEEPDLPGTAESRAKEALKRKAAEALKEAHWDMARAKVLLCQWIREDREFRREIQPLVED